ncbi:hepatic leukemia factor isoform X4 [Bradysia coprophila]|uniref:hepatic leukemia factor isoform X4 n=1 Tax=Bradysia coprophila TaxID=38358 RepID=UPI00187D794F|nr:hepatic leukemia factor isoform X4 [Bradysia coprophila]
MGTEPNGNSFYMENGMGMENFYSVQSMLGNANNSHANNNNNGNSTNNSNNMANGNVVVNSNGNGSGNRWSNLLAPRDTSEQQQQQQQPIHNTTSNISNSFASHQRNFLNYGNMACYQRIYNENSFNLPTNAQNYHHQYHNTQQHQHQQSKQYYNSGKSGNSKDICGDDKFKEDGDPWNVEAQAAFLGPNLWDKTLPYDTDLKVTHYADLDEFLSENNIPDGLPGSHLAHSTGLGHRSDSLGHSASLLGLGHITTKRERSPSPSDCVSPDTINPPSPAESTFSFASSGRDFDPRTRAFSDEELKPQPMIKKSRKQFVPDELKDDKYWARRRKNNIAAKRSRDARRQKENQIAMRARYLEKEVLLQNSSLHQELEQLKQENMELRARLSKYQDV